MVERARMYAPPYVEVLLRGEPECCDVDAMLTGTLHAEFACIRFVRCARDLVQLGFDKEGITYLAMGDPADEPDLSTARIPVPLAVRVLIGTPEGRAMLAANAGDAPFYGTYVGARGLLQTLVDDGAQGIARHYGIHSVGRPDLHFAVTEAVGCGLTLGDFVGGAVTPNGDYSMCSARARFGVQCAMRMLGLLVGDVLRTLAHLDDGAGIVHAAITPSNILVDVVDAPGGRALEARAVLCDFAPRTARSGGYAHGGARISDYPFAAPEVEAHGMGEVRIARPADVWSVGMVVVDMVLKMQPEIYDGPTAENARQLMRIIFRREDDDDYDYFDEVDVDTAHYITHVADGECLIGPTEEDVRNALFGRADAIAPRMQSAIVRVVMRALICDAARRAAPRDLLSSADDGAAEWLGARAPSADVEDVLCARAQSEGVDISTVRWIAFRRPIYNGARARARRGERGDRTPYAIDVPVDVLADCSTPLETCRALAAAHARHWAFRVAEDTELGALYQHILALPEETREVLRARHSLWRMLVPRNV